MIDRLKIMKRKLQDLKRKPVMKRFLREALNENSAIVEGQNRQQLLEGERSDDTNMPIYSPNSLRTRPRRGLPIGPSGEITLKHTGAFHRGFKATAAPNALVMGSTDKKSKKLVKSYGKEIFGLNKKNQEIIMREVVIPDMKVAINQYLTS